MRTGYCRHMISGLLGILFLLVPFVLASPEGGRRIRIELYGGFSTLNPRDLNARPEYDRLYEDYYTEMRYGAYHAAYGDYVTYSGQVNGQFNKIKQALPVGLRLKYELNPALSLSVGIKYLSSERESSVSYQYDVRIVDPDGVQFYEEFSLDREYDPYRISARAFLPMVGLHYKLGGSRFLTVEAFLCAGPLLGRCHFESRRYAVTLDSYGYSREVEESVEMTGRGTGLALDAGVQLRVRMAAGAFLFFEGGYAYQSCGKISGPGDSETSDRDSNAEGYTENAAWEGRWVLVEGRFNSEWGQADFSYPTNQYRTVHTPDFKLDLSGFQLRLGLSFQF
jgi:hypothetical protein